MNSDAELYTGVSGNESFDNEKPSKETEKAVQKQIDEIERLMPSVKKVLKTIEAEKGAICDFRSYLKEPERTKSANKIKDEFRARELYLGFLERLESEIRNKVMTAREVAK